MTSFENSKIIAKIGILHSTLVSISAVVIGLGVALYIFSAAYISQALIEYCVRPGEFYEGLCAAMGSDANRMADWSFLMVVGGIIGVIASTLYSRIKVNALRE